MSEKHAYQDHTRLGHLIISLAGTVLTTYRLPGTEFRSGEPRDVDLNTFDLQHQVYRSLLCLELCDKRTASPLRI